MGGRRWFDRGRDHSCALGLRDQPAVQQARLGPRGSVFHFWLEKCDSFWGRFAPFPYDASATENGIYGLGAAYLEAPINVVLLGILGWNLELCRRRWVKPADRRPFPARIVLVIACGWFLFLTALSLSPGFAGNFQFLAPYIQYVYRLVTHCNAALLVAVLVSGAWVASLGDYRREQQTTNLVAAVGLTVALLGLWMKLQHAAVVIGPENARFGSVIRRQAEVVPDLHRARLGARASRYRIARVRVGCISRRRDWRGERHLGRTNAGRLGANQCPGFSVAGARERWAGHGQGPAGQDRSISGRLPARRQA